MGLRASLCKILISSFAHKINFSQNFPVDYETSLEKFASVIFFLTNFLSAPHKDEMLVKYANFVKIQPIAPDKRARPKASNLLVILSFFIFIFKIIQVRIMDTFLCRKSEGTQLAR